MAKARYELLVVTPLSANEWQRRMNVMLRRLSRAEIEITECKREIERMLTQWVVAGAEIQEAGTDGGERRGG